MAALVDAFCRHRSAANARLKRSRPLRCGKLGLSFGTQGELLQAALLSHATRLDPAVGIPPPPDAAIVDFADITEVLTTFGSNCR